MIRPAGAAADIAAAAVAAAAAAVVAAAAAVNVDAAATLAVRAAAATTAAAAASSFRKQSAKLIEVVQPTPSDYGQEQSIDDGNKTEDVFAVSTPRVAATNVRSNWLGGRVLILPLI